MEWYYANQNDEQIRIEEQDLEKLTREGVVKRDTLVWNESMPDWKECQLVKPELFQMQTSPPTMGGERATETADFAMLPPPAPAAPESGLPPAMPTGVYSPKPAGPADGLAVGSLICGIVGLVASICSGMGIGLPISIAAVVCATMGRKKLQQAGFSTQDGRLTAGLVTGWVGVGIGILVVLVVILYFAMVATAVITSEI